MPYVNVGEENSGRIELYYKDWGGGPPVVFSHGWPLSADAGEDQMIFLASNGYRCIAHDRRGHGRSSLPWNGNDMNTRIYWRSSRARCLAQAPARPPDERVRESATWRYLK